MLRVVPARRLATETPVFPDKLFLMEAQIALRQVVVAAAVAVVAVVAKVVTVRITGGGILTVPDRTIRMSRG